MAMKLRLPRQAHISKTNEEDPIEYYYKPLIGEIYRQRLKMALRVLGGERFDHLLEIGYGSGVFLPTLSDWARQISAFDLHANVKPVQVMLNREHVRVNLWIGDIRHISAPSEKFDAVVCLSVLEHLAAPELGQAISEIARVSRPGTRIVLGFPRRNFFTDIFYYLSGFEPRSIHPASHEDIRQATEYRLRIVKELHFLPVLPRLFSIYTVLCCTRV